jgi:hypothetical protein
MYYYACRSLCLNKPLPCFIYIRWVLTTLKDCNNPHPIVSQLAFKTLWWKTTDCPSMVVIKNAQWNCTRYCGGMWSTVCFNCSSQLLKRNSRIVTNSLFHYYGQYFIVNKQMITILIVTCYKQLYRLLLKSQSVSRNHMRHLRHNPVLLPLLPCTDCFVSVLNSSMIYKWITLVMLSFRGRLLKIITDRLLFPFSHRHNRSWSLIKNCLFPCLQQL